MHAQERKPLQNESWTGERRKASSQALAEREGSQSEVAKMTSMLVSMRLRRFSRAMLAPGGEDAKPIHLLPTADERGKIHALPADPPGDVPRDVMV